MTFRISVTLRLSGQMQSGQLTALRTLISSHGRGTALDLAEVTLVDVEVVRFLVACEAQGVSLLNCSRYIRQWMAREQRRETP